MIVISCRQCEASLSKGSDVMPACTHVHACTHKHRCSLRGHAHAHTQRDTHRKWWWQWCTFLQYGRLELRSTQSTTHSTTFQSTDHDNGLGYCKICKQYATCTLFQGFTVCTQYDSSASSCTHCNMQSHLGVPSSRTCSPSPSQLTPRLCLLKSFRGLR